MADADFKTVPITFPAGWVNHSSGTAIGNDKYKPDRSFKDINGKVVCVIESSSTNDRKVGVGELCLADKFFSDSKIDGVLIFSLCGKSEHPPRPDTQADYLAPYFHHLRTSSHAHGVKEIYFIAESDFASVGWVALEVRFKEKARVLKA
jgi:hypothetical protein